MLSLDWLKIVLSMSVCFVNYYVSFNYVFFFFSSSHSEFNEIFEMQLTGATGGAILGAQLIARVTIAKSDSPNGVVRFINQSAITIPNPNSTLRLTLFVERADGLLGNATVSPI